MSGTPPAPPPTAAPDPELRVYVEAIEAHLRARRGVDHILSPRDFGLARAWYEAGVPLATVLVGMDRAFDGEPRANSLSFCRRRVEELVAAGAPPAPRRAPPPEAVPLKDVEALLATLLEKLGAVKPPAGRVFDPPLRKIREVQDLVAVCSRPNWSYLRSKLREIDDEVSACILQALSERDVAAFREEAARAIERHRGRVDERALDDAMHRFTQQRARERLGLPRVSLV